VRLAILGLGLIGGSMARAAVRAGFDVRAWTPSGDGPRAAERDGIEPAASIADAASDAELVVIAAPPLAALELIDALGDDGLALARHAVVTDVVSTKAAIVDRARRRGLRFVGGHPLAGRETSGYGAADPDLFRDRPWVVVPPEPADDEAVSCVEAVVAACGARSIRMSAAEHDRAVAAISHLPLLVSAALVEAVTDDADWSTAATLAAGGWSSMTRLARGDPEMGAGILATNREEVLARLDSLAGRLAAWRADLAAAETADLARARLAKARDRLERDAAS
jgi:prephenate dehydrogenase